MDLKSPIIDNKKIFFIFKSLEKGFDVDYLKSNKFSSKNLEDKILRLFSYVRESGNVILPNETTLKVISAEYVYLKLFSSRTGKSMYSITYDDITKNVDLNDIISNKVLSEYYCEFTVLGYPFKKNSLSTKWVENNGLCYEIRDSKIDKKNPIALIRDNVLYYTLFANVKYSYSEYPHLGLVSSLYRLDDMSLKTVLEGNIDSLRIKIVEELAIWLSQYSYDYLLEVPIKINNKTNNAEAAMIFRITDVKVDSPVGNILVNLKLIAATYSHYIDLKGQSIESEIMSSLNGLKRDVYGYNHPLYEYTLKETIKERLTKFANHVFSTHPLLHFQDAYVSINKIM